MSCAGAARAVFGNGHQIAPQKEPGSEAEEHYAANDGAHVFCVEDAAGTARGRRDQNR
jgi:hypothetical protein